MVAGDVVNEGGCLPGSTVTWRCASCTRHCNTRSPKTNLSGATIKGTAAHVHRFYAGYLDPEAQLPYRPSSRV
jgi:hypothetical protein